LSELWWQSHITANQTAQDAVAAPRVDQARMETGRMPSEVGDAHNRTMR
jgi:hypothetical protein